MTAGTILPANDAFTHPDLGPTKAACDEKTIRARIAHREESVNWCTRPNTSIRNQLVPRSPSRYRLNNSASVPGGSAGRSRARESLTAWPCPSPLQLRTAASTCSPWYCNASAQLANPDVGRGLTPSPAGRERVATAVESRLTATDVVADF
jgi:hypothetical protein